MARCRGQTSSRSAARTSPRSRFRQRSALCPTCQKTPLARPTSRPCAPALTTCRETTMGFTKPDLPKVDPETFMQLPLMDRMKFLAQNWAERGFGTPRMVHTIYIAKLLLLYVLGGVVVATATSGLPAFW